MQKCDVYMVKMPLKHRILSLYVVFKKIFDLDDKPNLPWMNEVICHG